MMIAALALAALIGAPQTAPEPDYLGRGCGYTPGANALSEIVFGNFDRDRRFSFADQYGRSVRVDGGWTHPDQTPFSDAPGAAWVAARPTINVKGHEYQLDGLPMVMGINEVRWIAEVDGRAVTAEPFPGVPERVFVLTEPLGCTFQRYVRKV